MVHEPWWTATARHADIVLPATTSLERNDIGGARRDKFIMAMQQAVAPVGAGAQRLRHLQRVWRSGSAIAEAYTQGPRRDGLAAASLREVPAQRRRQRRGAAGLRHVLAATAIWKFRRPARSTCCSATSAPIPDQHKLRTPSGKIELYSEKIAGFGYDDCPPHPTWIEPWEWLGGQDAETYPLHLVSSQPRDRLHSQMDCGPVSAGGKVAGREAITINPADAKARGIGDGDVVRVHNARGACLAGAIVSDTVSAGVVSLSCGAWYDPADDGEQPLCLHGNANVLTRDQGTSKLGQGPSSATALVEVERWTEPLQPVAAFDPPRVGRRLAARQQALLPAGRHHSDRRRGPARTEAAAVVAAAIESRISAAVSRLAVPAIEPPTRAAPRCPVLRLPVGQRGRLVIAGKKSIARHRLGCTLIFVGCLPARDLRERRRRQQQRRRDDGGEQAFAKSHHAAFEPHSRWLAIAAPSPSALSFAQTMLSTTIGSVRTAVPKPQSTPAITRSRPTMSA